MLRSLAFLIFFVVVSCGPKDFEKKVHEQQLSNSSPKSIFLKQDDSVFPGDVLSKENILNKRVFASSAYQRAADRFFVDLLAGKDSDLLHRLMNLLTSDCGLTHSECVFLKKLKRFRYFGDVMEQAFELSDDPLPEIDFQFLVRVLNLDNAVPQPALDRLFLRNVRNYLNTSAEKEFDTIVTNMIPDIFFRAQSNSAAEEMAQLLDELKPFDLIRKKNRTRFENLILNVSIRSALYREKSLNPKLVAIIEEGQKQDGSYAHNIDHAVSLNPLILRSLGIKKILEKNEYFWMVDGFYNESLSFDEVALIWESSRQEPKKFSFTVENYLKGKLAHLILMTNLGLKEYVEKSDRTKVMFFENLDDLSADLNPPWEEFKRKVLMMKELSSFVPSIYESRNEISRLFRFPAENFRYLMAYPHQLLTLYQASKNDFNLKFQFFGYNIEFNSAMLLRDLIRGADGGGQLFFNYATQRDFMSSWKDKVNVFQITYAFNFALRTFTFESFGVDPIDFIDEYIVKLAKFDQQILRKRHDKYIKALTTHPKGPQFQKVCSQLKAGEMPSVELDFKTMQVDPVLGALKEAFYEDALIASQVGGITKAVKSPLNPSGKEPLEAVYGSEVVSLRHLRVIRSMLHFYRSFVDELYKDSDSYEARIKQIDEKEAEVRSFYEGIYEFLTEYASMVKFHINCADNVGKLAKKLGEWFYFEEKAHIKEIWQGLGEKIRTGRTDYEPKRYESFYGFSGLDDFQGDTFLYNGMDFMARAAERIEQFNHRAKVYRPVPPFHKDDFVEKHKLFGDVPNRIILRYYDDFDQFFIQVLKGLRQAEYLNRDWIHWMGVDSPTETNDRISWYNYAGKAPAILSRFPYHEFTNLDCDGDCPRPMTEKFLIETNEKMLRGLKMSASDFESAKLLNVDNKYPIKNSIGLEQVFFRWTNKSAHGFFDYSYFMATKEKFGNGFQWPGDVRNQDVATSHPAFKKAKCNKADFSTGCEDNLTPDIDMYERYYDARRETNQKKFLFPLSDYVNDFWDKSMKSLLKSRITHVRNVEKEIRKVVCRDKPLPGPTDQEKAHPDKLVFHMTRHKEDHYYEYYLRPEIFPEQFSRKMVTLNQKTGGFFKDILKEPEEAMTLDNILASCQNE